MNFKHFLTFCIGLCLVILNSCKHPPHKSEPEIVLSQMPEVYGPEQALADRFRVNDSLYQVLFADNTDHELLESLRKETDSLYQQYELIRKAMNYDERYKYETIQFDTIDQKFSIPLKTAVNQYKDFIKSDFGPFISKEEVDKLLNTEQNNPEVSATWEETYFEHLPKSGIMVILTSMEVTLKSLEYQILQNIARLQEK